MKKILTLLSAAVLSLAAAAPVPQDQKPSFYRFDLSKTGLKKQKSGAWLWQLPSDKEKAQIIFDLDALKVMPNEFDEIRILLKNTKATSGVMVRITDYPSTDQARNWYSKTNINENELTDLRFDMRRDDDGWVHGGKALNGHRLEITLFKKYRRTPGEPTVRETEIHGIEFIRRSADISFDEFNAVYKETWLNHVWRYELVVQNRESSPRKVDLVIDTKFLKYYKTDWTKKTLKLGPREQVIVPLEIYISKSDAEKLPILYSERVLPKLIFPDAPAVFPLIGYRPRYVWGTIPLKKGGYKLELPEKETDRKKLIAQAEKDVVKPFCVPPQVAPAYCAVFKPREMDALSFYRFRDKKTGKDISKEDRVAASYIYHHNQQTFSAIKRMGQAYKLTGNNAYAEKIRDILLEYAYWFRFLPPYSPSSTAGGSRLSYTTLDLSYFLADGVEGYVAVKDSGVFGTVDQKKIEETIFLPLMKELYTHNIEFTNMQLHHISTYGISAIALDRAHNLFGDALYGDHGFHSFQDKGFTADGMALEGGVYHWYGVVPLLKFAAKMRASGVELIGKKFKPIYDHGIFNSPNGLAEGTLRSSYIEAWQLFKDKNYLPTLKLIKKLPAGIDPKSVPDTLDLGSTLQKNNGYAWLRENSKYGFRAAAINWIMGWDRLEHDRLTYRLFDEKGMISHEVHRVGYTNPGADMEATISHNTIVVDEKYAAPNASTLAAFLDRKSMPALLITENPESRLYPETDFSRVMAIFDGIIFVGDKVAAIDGKDHTYDWPFYNPWQPWTKPGKLEFNVPGKFDKQLKTSYEHVKSSYCAPASDGMKVNVDIPKSTNLRGFDVRPKPDRKLFMTFALPQKTTVAKFMIGRGHKPKPGPMLLMRQQGRGAEFACAFDVVKNGGKERIQSVKSLKFTPANPLSAVWEVKADSGTYYVIVNRTGKELICGDIKTTKDLEVIKK
ncbi:MAG: hypothetical protein IKB25_12395 [Lentisphaeria bacterium]|nr:hypothetical protein [Lentisphaeria bacterium]